MPITQPREWFETELPAAVQADPKKIENFTGTLLFQINGDQGGTWTLDIRDQKMNIKAEAAATPDITVTMKDADFVNFINKKLSGQMAFMTGKLKVKGNMQLAMKLNGLL
ncbi:MAG: SCP2 sterol-binding domain-containing protein [Deltaproteobacteria bacterium]|nr:SCP2 sterol-binding domain-containing protein [Deltaproteobacteria bacterium]